MPNSEPTTADQKPPPQPPRPSTRLYALIARKAPVAVVFRRGPSKQVLLLRWDLQTDLFYPGQWLKGRIYERRADLSPNGERLIYLAANQKPPLHAWTAISRPPYLTAGVLWGNMGTYGGGGLFDDEENLRLNESPGLMGSSETKANVSINRGKRSPAPRLNVTPLGSYGCGEDRPILDYRLKRDGWTSFQPAPSTRYTSGIAVRYSYDPPHAWRRSQPGKSGDWELRFIQLGYSEKNQGSWNVDVYELANRKARSALGLGRLDWADWCPSGDFLFSKDGCIWRLAIADSTELDLGGAKLIADLRRLRFRELAPPREALTWDEPVPLPPPLDRP